MLCVEDNYRKQNRKFHSGNGYSWNPIFLLIPQSARISPPLNSVPIPIRVNPIVGMGFFRDQLNLSDLFGGSWQNFNLNYETSSLIYRICFPAWDGLQIEHDPVYVGYILSTTDNSQVSEFPTTLVVSFLAAIVAALLVLFVTVKKRRHTTNQEQTWRMLFQTLKKHGADFLRSEARAVS
jgi:hypothetical protein